ncbi:MAG: PorP/SprF family type IX secretion system membrane protein [Chitinophagales bacterium]
MKQFFTLFALLTCLACMDAKAQQDAQYTQYMFNGLALNPAYAGTRDAISATAIYRHQWAGVVGAPRTFSFSVHSPLQEQAGLGLFVESDRIGIHNRLSLFASYAYRIVVGEGQLSIGLQGGLLNYQSDWNNLPNVADPGDVVLANPESKLLPNFGLGIHYYTERFYVGASIPHMLDNELSEVSLQALQSRHYFITSGALIDLSTTLKVKPSIMLKAVSGSPLAADLNLSFLIRDVLWLGAGYRFGDALTFLGSFQFNNGLRLGYAYDLTRTDLQPTGGTHEVMLGFDFIKEGDNPVLNPRFFW